MSDFVLDLIVENKRLNGEWVECDDPDLSWYGCRFLVKPATTRLAERIEVIRKRAGERNITRFTEAILKDLLVDVSGIGTGEREATLDEVIQYFSQIPAFVTWIMEKSMTLATRKREEAAVELGN